MWRSLCVPRIFSLENLCFGFMCHLYEMPYIFSVCLEFIVKNQNIPLRTTSPMHKKRYSFFCRYIIWYLGQFQATRGRFHLKCRYWELYLCVEVGCHYCLRMLCNTYLKFSIFPTQREAQQLYSKEPGVSTLCSVPHKYFMLPLGSIKYLFR